MTFEHLGEAYRELLRYGARLEVLEPVELRERLAETSRRLVALYGA
jgi:predicted DNA-binding transcriptional regulator YafY